MIAAGPAGVPAVHVGLFQPRPGSPATNPWLVFALMGSLTRAIAWIAVTWQRFRTSGGVLRRTITEPAGDEEAPTDPQKVLVNALRAVHQMAGTLIRWLVTRTTVFPASAVVTMLWEPLHRSTRPGTQNRPGVTDPSPQSGQKRCANPEIVIPRSTKPSEVG